jgi:hypothetical protein
MTSRKKHSFLKAFSTNRTNITEACKSANVSRTIYYKWLEKDPTFAQEVTNIQESLLDMCEGHVFAACEKGDIGMVKWVLEHRGQDRGWGPAVPKQQVEHMGAMKVEIARSIIPNVPE